MTNNQDIILQKINEDYDPEYESAKGDVLEIINDMGSIIEGRGMASTSIQNRNVFIDRFHKSSLPYSQYIGYTFITRPALNMRTSNLRQDRVMNQLTSMDPTSIPFMIRSLLDPYWCYAYRNIVSKSPLVDIRNPFLTPLSNGLVGISGFPDFTIESQTTDGGFQSEDMSMAIGSDMLRKSRDLTLVFENDPSGSVLALQYFLSRYIALQCKNYLAPYSKHDRELRLNYSSTIYRFTLDITHCKIVNYAKATGCYCQAAPMGALFNIQEGESYVEAARKFSVPWKANFFDYNDPIILKEFNMLVRRFNGIDNIKRMKNAPPSLEMNYVGIPWVEHVDGENYLTFKYGENDDAYRRLEREFRTKVDKLDNMTKNRRGQGLIDMDRGRNVQQAIEPITEMLV